MKFLLSTLAVATVAAQSACVNNPCGLNSVCEDNANSPTGYSCIPLPSQFRVPVNPRSPYANVNVNAQVFNGVYGAPQNNRVMYAPRAGGMYAPRAVYAAPQAVRVMVAPEVAAEEEEEGEEEEGEEGEEEGFEGFGAMGEAEEMEPEGSFANWADAMLNADAYDDYALSFNPIFENEAFEESPVAGLLYAGSMNQFGAGLQNRLNRAKGEGNEEEVKELTMQVTENNFYKVGANAYLFGENEGGNFLDGQGYATRAAAIQEELREMNPNSEEAYNLGLEYDVYNGKTMRSYARYFENEELNLLSSLQVGQTEAQLAQIEMVRAQNAFRMNPSRDNQEELELANMQVQAQQMETNALTTEVFEEAFEELLGGQMGAIFNYQKWMLRAEISRRREAIEARKYFQATGMNPYTDPRATDFKYGAKNNAPFFGDVSLFGTNF